MDSDDSNQTNKQAILRDLCNPIKPGSRILDLGCGNGKSVQKWRDLGYPAFGCDIKFKDENSPEVSSMLEENIIRLIQPNPYLLPFENNSFDFIFSDQVFEHVQNYSETISEINRILKPDGYCLHIFPSRYKIIESHTHVPFSSIIRSPAWLFLWAITGIRNKLQTGLTAKETTRLNYDYLINKTNYLAKKQITLHFKQYFEEIIYCENLSLKHSQRGRWIYKLSNVLPYLPAIYATLRSRIIFTRLPKKIST
jgi:ubiquinone/menaquinone biosynthesis C-methylase UbiE